MNRDNFAIVMINIGQAIKDRGYKRKGSTFENKTEDVLLMVNIQKSAKGGARQTTLTVNLGVFILSEKLGQLNRRPTIWDCHWRRRLGNLLPRPADQWWQIEDENSAYLVAHEIIRLLGEFGFPALDRVSSSAKLVSLWQTGQSPGLTEFECKSLLAKLGGTH